LQVFSAPQLASPHEGTDLVSGPVSMMPAHPGAPITHGIQAPATNHLIARCLLARDRAVGTSLEKEIAPFVGM